MTQNYEALLELERESVRQLGEKLAKAQNQVADFRRQLGAERDYSNRIESTIAEVRARNRELEPLESLGRAAANLLRRCLVHGLLRTEAELLVVELEAALQRKTAASRAAAGDVVASS